MGNGGKEYVFVLFVQPCLVKLFFRRNVNEQDDGQLCVQNLDILKEEGYHLFSDYELLFSFSTGFVSIEFNDR